MTVGEILITIQKIETTTDALAKMHDDSIKNKIYETAIDLLEEYADELRNKKVSG